MHSAKQFLTVMLLVAAVAGLGFAQTSRTGFEVITNVFERP